MQVTQQALHALSALLLATPKSSYSAADAPRSLAGDSHPMLLMHDMARTLCQYLQRARYHQVKSVRSAAVEAATLLSDLVPDLNALPQHGQALAKVGTRKGPWLHQRLDQNAEEQQCIRSSLESHDTSAAKYAILSCCLQSQLYGTRFRCHFGPRCAANALVCSARLALNAALVEHSM
jgi:hypothetical protein